jgi:hypothetical protein
MSLTPQNSASAMLLLQIVGNYKTSNVRVRIDVILRRVSVTIVAVEKQ